MSKEFDKSNISGVLEELGVICEKVCEDVNNDILSIRSKIQTSIQEKLEARNFPVDETTLAFMISAIVLTIFNF